MPRTPGPARPPAVSAQGQAGRPQRVVDVVEDDQPRAFPQDGRETLAHLLILAGGGQERGAAAGGDQCHDLGKQALARPRLGGVDDGQRYAARHRRPDQRGQQEAQIVGPVRLGDEREVADQLVQERPGSTDVIGRRDLGYCRPRPAGVRGGQVQQRRRIVAGSGDDAPIGPQRGGLDQPLQAREGPVLAGQDAAHDGQGRIAVDIALRRVAHEVRRRGELVAQLVHAHWGDARSPPLIPHDAHDTAGTHEQPRWLVGLPQRLRRLLDGIPQLTTDSNHRRPLPARSAGAPASCCARASSSPRRPVSQRDPAASAAFSARRARRTLPGEPPGARWPPTPRPPRPALR